jgi:TolB-like protein/Tfp pilus assembly protein PilF
MSYASEDAGAAERICESLRGAGVEVWFDQSELRGGDAGDTAIRRQIKACDLFIPIVSASSHSRSEGYFRLEWKLAVDRSHLMAPDRPFLVPVVIDDTDQADQSVPDRFREMQWTCLPEGHATPAFVERIKSLLSPDSLRVPAMAAGVTPSAARIAAQRRRSPRVALAWLVLPVIAFGCFFAARFIFPLHRNQVTQPATATIAISEKSIAVLPFLDLSEGKDQEYFADGMSEELIDLLSQVKELQVIARTSSFYFKGRQATIAQIAKQLAVASVLEGSVRKSGHTVRVAVQLIRADSGVHQWSQTYDRDMKDIFRVQDDIAAAVVGALKLTLLPDRQLQTAYRSANPEAYDLYLLGRQHSQGTNAEAARSAIDDYRKAIELDPAYAAAYAGLSDAEEALSDFVDNPNVFQRQALADAEKAVELAPDQAVGYIARGAMRQDFSWDWAGAQGDFEKALALDSGNSSAQLAYSALLATLGRLPEALVAGKRATQLDPLSKAAWSDLARLLTSTRQFAAALQANSRVLDLDPGYAYAVNGLGRLQLFRGQPTEALLTFRRVEIEELRLMGISIAEHTLGHKIESQQALDALIAKGASGWAYQIAEIYAWRGENDKAFEWLERAYAQRDSAMPGLKSSPVIQLSNLPKDPRYSALLRKLKLPV